MDRVTVFRSYRDSAKILAEESVEVAFEYIMAILDYGMDEAEPSFTSKMAEAAFVLTRPTLELGRERAAAGAAGGRATRRKTEAEPTEKPETQAHGVNYGQVVDAYHEICKSYPRVRSITETRKKAIMARLRTYSVDAIRECFAKAEASDFLKGKNSRNWSANFDWLIKDANMAKTLEGNYDNKTVAEKAIAPPSSEDYTRSRKQIEALRKELQ